MSNNILVQIFNLVLLYLFPEDAVTNYCELVVLNDILSVVEARSPKLRCWWGHAASGGSKEKALSFLFLV